MDLSGRIKTAREYLGYNQSEFAAKINTTLKRIINLENSYVQKLNNTEIEGLARLGFNQSWLIMGLGEMWLNEPVNDKENISSSVNFLNYASLAADNNESPDASGMKAYNFYKHAFKKISANSNALSLLLVEGDSMEPQFRQGDQLFVDTSQQTLTKEGLYVVRMHNIPLVKLVQLLPNGYRLLSHNPKYPPIEITNGINGNNITILGYVIAAIIFTY